MKYSRKTIQFATLLADQYAKYDPLAGCYVIDQQDIADFDRHELAGLMYDDNRDYAIDAVGPDNRQFDNKMLPTLLQLLRDNNNKDVEQAFVRRFKEGMTQYIERDIQALLEDQINSLHSAA